MGNHALAIEFVTIHILTKHVVTNMPFYNQPIAKTFCECFVLPSSLSVAALEAKMPERVLQPRIGEGGILTSNYLDKYENRGWGNMNTFEHWDLEQAGIFLLRLFYRITP